MSGVNLSNVGPSKKKPGARDKFRLFHKKAALAAFALFFSAVSAFCQSSDSISPSPRPADIPKDLRPMIGDYKIERETILVYESDGDLHISAASQTWSTPIREPLPRMYGMWFSVGLGLEIATGTSILRVTSSSKEIREVIRSDYASQRPAVTASEVASLLKTALVADPPVENGQFRKADLVELTELDSAIHLDIRYATANDFLGVPVYTQARAFLQRPAAEALLRVLHKLQPLGYGLLIHDGYRPWYVTKIFWDATPAEGKIFVADPAQGSRHNRGCAVDLTLYDLKTGQPIEMTGGYDEMSPRSFPNYPGGTSLQRWHRDLLRRAMESEGFTVYESEWWHFDYKDWREYGILNIPFEKLSIGSASK